jgi:hypothetical protein
MAHMSTTIDPKKLAAACAAAAKAHAKLPLADERMTKADIEELVDEAESLEDLLALAEPGEPYSAFALMLVARHVLPAPPENTTTQRIEGTDVHHGDLVVSGDLALKTDLWVTGSVEVSGVIDTAEDASLYVAGDLRTRGLRWIGPRGTVIIGGALHAKELVTVTESLLVVCGAIATPFVFVSAIGGDVVAPRSGRDVTLWIGTDEAMEDGSVARESMKTILAPDLFLADEREDETDAVIRRAWERVIAREPIACLASPGKAPRAGG